MPFAPMPELATGLTNIAIIISAVCCLLSLPRRRELRQWRLFFLLLALDALFGAAVHSLVLAPTGDFLLWLGFDLCIGPTLSCLVLAAWQDCRGEPSARLRRICGCLGLLVSLLCLAALLWARFRDQFFVAAAGGSLAIGEFIALQAARLRQGERARALLALTGIGLAIAFGAGWLLGSYVISLGSWQLNQAAVLHLGAALALPFLRASAARPQ